MSSPTIFEEMERKNKCLLPLEFSHNTTHNGREAPVNIDLLSNGNHDHELRRIEKIAVEAQIEIDQFSHIQSDRPSQTVEGGVKTNPSEINFDSILPDKTAGGSDTSHPDFGGQDISLSLSGIPGPELSDVSILNRILSSGSGKV